MLTPVQVEHNAVLAHAGAAGLDPLACDVATAALRRLALATGRAEEARGGGGNGRDVAPGGGGYDPQAADAQPGEEAEAVLPALNAAVIAWQRGRRDASSVSSRPLFRFVEALPPHAALRLSILALDGHLHRGDAGAAASVAAWLEKALGCGPAGDAPPPPNGAAATHHPQLLLPPASPAAAEALAQLAVAKAKLHVLCGAPKAAKRELSAVSSTPEPQQQAMGASAAHAAVLRAGLERSRGRASKAERALSAAADAADCPCLRAATAYDAAILLSDRGKHAAASAVLAVASSAADASAAAPFGGAGTAPPSEQQRADIEYAKGALAQGWFSTVCRIARIPNFMIV